MTNETDDVSVRELLRTRCLLVVALIGLLGACAPSYAQTDPTTIDGPSVKEAILDGAAVYICIDRRILNFLGVDTAECRSRTNMYARAC